MRKMLYDCTKHGKRNPRTSSDRSGPSLGLFLGLVSSLTRRRNPCKMMRQLQTLLEADGPGSCFEQHTNHCL